MRLQIIYLFLYIILPSTDYMAQKLVIEEKKIPEMNRALYQNYGTTMAGLKVWYYCHFLRKQTFFEDVIQLNNAYICSLSRQLGTTLTMMTIIGTNLTISTLLLTKFSSQLGGRIRIRSIKLPCIY
jgi:hypothetical protein